MMKERERERGGGGEGEGERKIGVGREIGVGRVRPCQLPKVLEHTDSGSEVDVTP